MRDAPVDDVIEAIRGGGLAVIKAHRIQAVLRMLTDDEGRVTLPDLRRMRRKRAVELLTDLPGVGRKTAACVLALRRARCGPARRYARAPRCAARWPGPAAHQRRARQRATRGRACAARLLRLPRQRDPLGSRGVQGASAALRGVPTGESVRVCQRRWRPDARLAARPRALSRARLARTGTRRQASAHGEPVEPGAEPWPRTRQRSVALASAQHAASASVACV